MTPKLVNVPLFKFYAQKVLPTVYDDALSYEEVLMKIAAKLDELIIANNAQNDVINNLPTDVSAFAEMLREFKVEMESEFDTFTEAINASIEEFETEVNNKIITDETPTQGSEHLVTSNGVWASIKTVTDSLVKDLAPTENSNNYVTSGGVYTAIQNAINNLTTAINAKQDRLTFDTEPTQNSLNPVQSGGIYTAIEQAKTDASNALDNYAETMAETIGDITDDISALQTGKQDTLAFDTTPTEGSTNPVTSEGIARAIEQAVPTITIDPAPAQGSGNAVSSGGVYTALQNERESTDLKLTRKQDTLAFDMMPTQNSTNPVYSGGVWEALAQISPSVTIDAYPTEGSAHAVSSGGVYTYVANIANSKQNTLNWDTTPTLNSLNPVTSDGIRRAIDAGGGGGGGTIDPTPTEGSSNAVSSGGVYTALQGKQDTLTFDTTPTALSDNPVTSDGIRVALNGKQDTLTFDTTPAYDSPNAITSGAVYHALGDRNYLVVDSTFQPNSTNPASGVALNNLYTILNQMIVAKQNKILQSSVLTLTANEWSSNEITINYAHDTTMRNVIDVVSTDIPEWSNNGVYAYSETSTTITFKCNTAPTNDLHFYVTSMGVN